MRNTILIFLLVIGTYSLQAADRSTGTFIIIGSDTYFCDEVHPGKAFTRIYNDGKLFMKVPTAIVKAYAHGNKFYEYLPVINTEKDTTGWAFMEYITSQDGNRLYRFCSNCIHYDPVSGKIDPVLPVYRYYTFKQGVFISVTDDQNNLRAQLSSFNVKVVA
jgi:hypothetical protein